MLFDCITKTVGLRNKRAGGNIYNNIFVGKIRPIRQTEIDSYLLRYILSREMRVDLGVWELLSQIDIRLLLTTNLTGI